MKIDKYTKFIKKNFLAFLFWKFSHNLLFDVILYCKRFVNSLEFFPGVIFRKLPFYRKSKIPIALEYNFYIEHCSFMQCINFELIEKLYFR